jgi:hypothetical protein
MSENIPTQLRLFGSPLPLKKRDARALERAEAGFEDVCGEMPMVLTSLKGDRKVVERATRLSVAETCAHSAGNSEYTEPVDFPEEDRSFEDMRIPQFALTSHRKLFFAGVPDLDAYRFALLQPFCQTLLELCAEDSVSVQELVSNPEQIARYIDEGNFSQEDLQNADIAGFHPLLLDADWSEKAFERHAVLLANGMMKQKNATSYLLQQWFPWMPIWTGGTTRWSGRRARSSVNHFSEERFVTNVVSLLETGVLNVEKLLQISPGLAKKIAMGMSLKVQPVVLDQDYAKKAANDRG